jgi:hypothetical protein
MPTEQTRFDQVAIHVVAHLTEINGGATARKSFA